MEDFLANFDYLDICHVLEAPGGPSGPTSTTSHVTLNHHPHHGGVNHHGNFLPEPVAPPILQPPLQNPQLFNVSRFFGRWIRGVTAGGRPFVRASHWANPQFVLHLPTPDSGDPEGLASIVVALLQSDARPLRHRAPRLLSIGFVLYRVSQRYKIS